MIDWNKQYRTAVNSYFESKERNSNLQVKTDKQINQINQIKHDLTALPPEMDFNPIYNNAKWVKMTKEQTAQALECSELERYLLNGELPIKAVLIKRKDKYAKIQVV